MQTHRFRALSAALLITAAACQDATAPSPQRPAQPAGPAVSRVLGTVTCYVDVAAGTHRCGDPRPAGGGSQTRVALNTSHFTVVTGLSFTSGGIANFFNQIQNDLGQAIGTHDGIFSDSIRAFVTAINVTGGSGTVTAYNHTGTGTFTAANQPYWLYEEIVEPNGERSTSRTWQFSVPGTVSAWNYTVGVSAPIAHPNGWVSVTGDEQIPYGSTRDHVAVVHGWTGAVVTTGAVSWSRVNGSGNVYVTPSDDRTGHLLGVLPGTAEITASYGSATPAVYGVEVY